LDPLLRGALPSALSGCPAQFLAHEEMGMPLTMLEIMAHNFTNLASLIKILGGGLR